MAVTGEPASRVPVAVGPRSGGGTEMAEKKIKPKAPEKAEPAAGAREASERGTLKQSSHRGSLKAKRGAV